MVLRRGLGDERGEVLLRAGSVKRALGMLDLFVR
jgi:hypothetical protein